LNSIISAYTCTLKLYYSILVWSEYKYAAKFFWLLIAKNNDGTSKKLVHITDAFVLYFAPLVEFLPSCTIPLLTPNNSKSKLVTPWYIYIVENKLSQYYTGICTNIERRFAEHQSSGPKCAKALKGKGPLTLKFRCKVDSHSDALKLEIWIKKLNKADKVKLVNNRLCDAPIQNLLMVEVSKHEK
jgi:putative endonuclease